MGLKGQLFSSPPRVVFGQGVAGDVGAYVRQLGGARPMVVTDPVIAAMLEAQIERMAAFMLAP
jgi:glycerol dehydrogenase-like iron-containing ADH family enzyme